MSRSSCRMAGEWWIRLANEGSRHVTWDIGRKRPSVALRRPQVSPLAGHGMHPDVVHARSRMPAWVAWLAWRRMPPAERPRFVTTVHGLYSVGHYSAVMTRGERVIAVSETARRYALGQLSGPRRRSRVTRIYRGVDQARFRKGYRPSADWLQQWRAAYPTLGERPMVVLPGRITRLKGHTDFVAAMSAPRHQGRRCRGRGRGRRRAQAPLVPGNMLGETGTGSRVHGPPVRRAGNHGARRPRSSRSSTRPESFGRTVLEALSLGTPVVGYDHGGVGEILAAVYPEGRVPVGDPATAAGRLARVLADPAAARQAVRDHDFDVHRMCAETLAVYEELAGHAPTAAANRVALMMIAAVCRRVGLRLLLVSIRVVAAGRGQTPPAHPDVPHDPPRGCPEDASTSCGSHPSGSSSSSST